MSFFYVVFLVKNMKLSIFHEYGEFSISLLNKIVLFFVFKSKLKTEFGISFREWNITFYVFNENFIIWKYICSKKSHIKLKKFLHQQNNFFFKFYMCMWKICRNRLVLFRDMANIWLLKISVFEIILIFNFILFYVSIPNLV